MIKILQASFLFFLILSPQIFLGQSASLRLEKIMKKKENSASSAGWIITSDHVSSSSGIHHIYYQQILNGILLKGTESSVHFSSDGTLISENHFFNDGVGLKTYATDQRIDPKTAVTTASNSLGYTATSEFVQKKKEISQLNQITFSDGGIAADDITATLFYDNIQNKKYQLVWEVSVFDMDNESWLVVSVDALSGSVLKTKDILQKCAIADTSLELTTDFNKNLTLPKKTSTSSPTAAICEVCYEVFPVPTQSPLEGDRAVVQNPADPIASPFGWHDLDGTNESDTNVTMGNNVTVKEKGDNNGYQTNGGPQLDFTGYPFQPIFTIENQYEDAAITNAFYWNNILHDITYRSGFDEASGSLQKLNYYTSGRNNSDFDVRIQSRIGCNAWYSGGGSRPIMILGYCDDKDSAYDSVVIAHEYAHGIVNQLIGGLGSSGCVSNNERMTEGWADYLGILLTMKPEDVGADRRTIGNFYFGQGIEGRGIRAFPYSTDMEINPQTYGDIASGSIPHGVGSVWATAIWEMTWSLIDTYGFDDNFYSFTGEAGQDAGNIMALAIVLEGMKLMRCDPGFIDARDAILLAAQSIYGLDSQCVIFDAFAKRGLGLYAEQGSTDSAVDGTEDFTPYPTTAQMSDFPVFCYSEETISNLGGGLPIGGVYSGEGIVDDGNGRTFSIDPLIVGIGTTTVNYEVMDSRCTVASTAQKSLTIERDTEPPVLTSCPLDFEETISIGNIYILPDMTLDVVAWDYCTDNLIIVQSPPKFTELSEGRHPITMTISDTAGNEVECTYTLQLILEGDASLEFLTEVLLYPIPSSSEVMVYNPTAKRINTIYIRDVNGRLITSLNPASKALRIPIDITPFSVGTYFLTIEGEGDTIVRRMTKR